MKKLKFAFFLLFVFSVAAFAQSPDKILKQAEKALGGAKNLRAVRSMRLAGTIRSPQSDAGGAFLLQTAQPNSFNQFYDLNGIETETGFNGKSGWARDSRGGLQTLTGRQSLDLATEADFKNTLWLDYKKDKSKIAAGGAADVNGKPAKIVVLTSVKGAAVKMYFDAATNLPVRYEFPANGAVKTYDFSDYRAAGKILAPFAMQLKDGETVYQINLTDVKINEPIARAEFDYPPNAGDALPDIPQLLKELYKNTDEKVKIVEDYSYNEKIAEREFDKNGNLAVKESATYQVSFYKGFRLYRQIEKNEQPLSEKEQQKADADAQKGIAEIDKWLAKKAEKDAKAKPEDQKEKTNFYAEVLKASNLVNPRREKFRGRDVIVFDFEPNPNFDLKNATTMLKVFGKVAGVIWIDERDKEVVRMEAVLADSFNYGGGLVAKLKKGASFVLEQDRVNDEIWLPSLTEINLSVRVFLVKGMSLNQTVKTYNYSKFKTEVKDSKIDEIKNQ